MQCEPASTSGQRKVPTPPVCHAAALSCWCVVCVPVQACDRGGNFIEDKVAEVLRVGGTAMVLMNVPGGRTNLFLAAPFGIPYVHLATEYREAVVEYAARATATATVGALTAFRDVTAPAMADFSSKGPPLAGRGMVIKPDITAPGVLQQQWKGAASKVCPLTTKCSGAWAHATTHSVFSGIHASPRTCKSKIAVHSRDS